MPDVLLLLLSQCLAVQLKQKQLVLVNLKQKLLMALNLTYDSSDDPTALAEAEQRDLESYEIGERLEQEQNNLLAGKYRDAEELEQAYVELQRKLGSRNEESASDESEEDAEPVEDEEDNDPVDYSFLNRLAEEADTGEFTKDTLEALDGMSASDIADMFLAYRQEAGGEPEPQYEISGQDIAELKGVVGGDQDYDNMISWASQNLAPQEIQLYDAVMDKGDPQAIYFAIQALNYRFKDSVGFEGQMLTGTAARTTDVFRSQAEVVRAMGDPRYDNDPAYRQDVFNKLERSPINF